MVTGLKILPSVLMLCIAQGASAEPLPDPTRPAIDLAAGSGAGRVLETVPAEAVPHGLQSVIISPQHRAAIINGETVDLGGKYGNSRLVEVRENSVVLESSHGRRVMEMFPKVNIKKNEMVQPESELQGRASSQPIVPDKAVGEIK